MKSVFAIYFTINSYVFTKPVEATLKEDFTIIIDLYEAMKYKWRRDFFFQKRLTRHYLALVLSADYLIF